MFDQLREDRPSDRAASYVIGSTKGPQHTHTHTTAAWGAQVFIGNNHIRNRQAELLICYDEEAPIKHTRTHTQLEQLSEPVACV